LDELLGSQALPIEPSPLTSTLVRQVTSIDGAVLVDPEGKCHAIGVILDGTAGTFGDRSRGARFNSAARYLSDAPIGTVIILVSEDGMVNLLPNLAPQVRRSELDALLQNLRDAAAVEPADGPKFAGAFEKLERMSFYLSQAECDEGNALYADHWERRRAAGATLWPLQDDPLKPDPSMDPQDYIID
jgi:hypothetical protein